MLQKNRNFKLHTVNSQVDGYLDFTDYPLTDDTTAKCVVQCTMEAFAKTLPQTSKG